MPRDPTTGVFTRVDNSFSEPVNGTIIDPGAADGLFDDYDDGLSSTPGTLLVTEEFVREKLTASRTYYVRTDGSNSNTGLADNAGGAFLTIQKAVDVIYGTLDLGGNTVNIQVRAGTYATPILVTGSNVGGGTVFLAGDSTTPSNVVISTTSSIALTMLSGAKLTVEGFKFTTASSGACIAAAGSGTELVIIDLVMGACAESHFQVDNGAIVTAYASGVYTINGSASSHVHVTNNAQFYANTGTITISGTPAFSSFFIGMSQNATSTWNSVTFSGSATGQRFFIHTGAVVNIGGTTNLTYFPGDANGLLNEGGIYDVLFGTGAIAVGSLPTPNAGIKGARTMVTNANATTFLSTVAAGGSNVVPVVCDGTNWVIG